MKRKLNFWGFFVQDNKPATLPEKTCGARDHEYYCTLVKDHEGDHMAHGNIRKTPYHIWAASPQTESTKKESKQ